MSHVVAKRRYDLGNDRSLTVVRKSKSDLVLFSVVRGNDPGRYESRVTFCLNGHEATDLAKFITGIGTMGRVGEIDCDEEDTVPG